MDELDLILDSAASLKADRDLWRLKAIDRAQEVDELRDEVTRLRGFMPADVLREYDRQKEVA